MSVTEVDDVAWLRSPPSAPASAAWWSNVPHVALARVAATTWRPEDCPLCRTGSVAIKPGSRA